MGGEIDSEQLIAYFENPDAPSTRAVVEQWVAADRPRRTAQLEVLRLAWHRSAEIPLIAGDAAEPDATAGWHAVADRAGIAADAGHRGRRRPSQHYIQPRGKAGSSSRGWRVSVVVAGAVAVIGAGIAIRLRLEAFRPAALVREYATVSAQREMVTLGDGTQITLAPASRLRLAERYGVARRDVYLEGQAYFTVAHDPARPFVLHAGRATAEDLGTRFAVRAYGTDAVVRVAVTQGSVAVGGAALRSGDAATIAAGGQVHVARGVDIGADTAWTDGELRFENTPVSAALADFARWYDVEFRLTSSALPRTSLTGTFRAESLPEALTTLAAALGARYERRGRVVTFTPTTSPVRP